MDDDLDLFMNGMVEPDPNHDKVMERRDLFRGAGTLAAWLLGRQFVRRPGSTGRRQGSGR